MRSRRPSNRALRAILAGVSLVLIGAAGAQSASARAPWLRVLEPARLVEADSNSKGRIDTSQLGLQIAAYGGNFQVNVWRPKYSEAFRAAQVSHRTGKILRRIPSRLLSVSLSGGLISPGPVFRGVITEPLPTGPRLLRFLHLTFRDHGGHVAAHALLSFCPAWSHQRVDDQGPAVPIFPDSCNSFGFGNPFVRGMVMGVEKHWSAPLSGYTTNQPRPKLDPGTYTVTAKITGRYRRLFKIPRRVGRVRFRVRVRKSSHSHPIPVDRASGAAPTGTRRAGRPAPVEGVPSLKDPPLSSRPDLIATAAWGITLRHTKSGHDILGFGATAWNAGPSPMDVEGFRQARRRFMHAYQYFRDGHGRVIGRARVGNFDYDSRHGHDHWHFEQFAAYSLLNSKGKRLLRSSKQSFCLAPTDPIDFTVPGADWLQTAVLLQTSCASDDPTALWVREVLQAGWGDTYIQSVAGQAFDVTDLPNGRYLIRIRVNPLGKLIERNRSNDMAQRRLRITGAPGHRKVHVSRWRGIAG
jgi:hypothetical protein